VGLRFEAPGALKKSPYTPFVVTGGWFSRCGGPLELTGNAHLSGRCLRVVPKYRHAERWLGAIVLGKSSIPLQLY